MKHLFQIFPVTALCLFSSILSADEGAAISMEAKRGDMAGVLLDRVKMGGRPATKFEDGKAGIVHLEYADMPDEKWQQVRWIVRFPTKDFKGKKAARATLTTVLYTVIGDRQHPLQLELIEGGQGERIAAGDRVVNGGAPLAIVIPDTLPGELEIDVTEMVNEAIELGLEYVAFRFSASAQDDPYPGEEQAAVYYFVSVENPEGWKRDELPQLYIKWEP